MLALLPTFVNRYTVGLFLFFVTVVYVQHLRLNVSELTKENIQLQDVMKAQKETIVNLRKDIESVRLLEKTLQEEKDKIEVEKKKLNETLYREKNKKKSLEELALKKTSLIEKLVNNATEKTLKCFEVISSGGDC